jgi:hypothetical protein
MAKAKTAYFPENSDRSGIDITFTKSRNHIYISGWYDTNVGIESTGLTLKEFFDKLGITELDCKTAFMEESS